MSSRVVFVGELNPYGARPEYALADFPSGASGDRLRRRVLAVSSATYDQFLRYNLCTGIWSTPRARVRAGELLAAHPGAICMVALGRKVAEAFGCGSVKPFEAARRDGEPPILCLPHPSGLNRTWVDPEAAPRARTALSEIAPDVPWGENINGPALTAAGMRAAARNCLRHRCGNCGGLEVDGVCPECGPDPSKL